jgi:maltose alpha-D-glucosyltransferase/alpha-amylase
MTHAWGINKDGGYIRTGARTPMQWTNGKNRGFSETNGELYLPVNDVATQCVEEQQSRENSLFNTIKKLIKIRNENSALNADGNLKIVRSENNGYPLVYERSDDKNTFIIAINPSECESSLRLDGKVVLSQNSCVDNGIVKLMGKSFVILQR